MRSHSIAPILGYATILNCAIPMRGSICLRISSQKVLPQERSEFYQYPFMRREEISTVPDWLKQAVVYNIFPDSFASEWRFIRGTPSETGWGEPMWSSNPNWAGRSEGSLRI